MADVQQLKRRFVELHGGDEAGIKVFQAPGRVNLIGEHTDYNGGYVFPGALTFGTTLLLRRRSDDQVALASTNFELRKQISIKDLAYDKADDWMNYPKGIIYMLQQQGCDIGGYDVLYHGEIPNGSGLSSSASIGVVTAYGLQTVEGRDVSSAEERIKIALLVQQVENKFIGVNTGIMDQFAVAMGKKDHAILLLCDTLEYEHVPFKTGSYKIVIGNTNKRRGLVDSKYNERRGECDQAVADLQQAYPGLTLLGQLTLEQFEQAAHLIGSETVRKRARHVVEEIDRVKRAVEVLKQGNLEAFGKLMVGSHDSLRDLYEVTGPELDAMVEEALRIPGTIGSRMTGAGFGGCTVSLVHEDSVETFQQQVGARYKERTGLTADFYVCDIGDGAVEVK
jgi:galactokinase